MNCPTCGKETANWRSKCEHCGADLKGVHQEVVPLEQQLLKQQGGLTTRGSSLTSGFGGLGCSLAVLAAFIAFVAFGARLGVDLGPLGILIGPVGIFGGAAYLLYSIWQIIQGTVVSNRKLTCPECGEAITILSTEKTFLCPKCSELILLGKDNTAGLKKVSCPVCAAHWVASDDLGARTCHSCGASLEVSEGSARMQPKDDTCPVCKQPVQKSVYACPECGTLRSKPHLNNLPYYQTTHQLESGLYKDDGLNNLPKGFQSHSIWRVSPQGELIRAAWLGKVTAEAVEKSEVYTLITQVIYLQRLVKGISSLNLALEDPVLVPGVQAVFDAYTPLLLAVLQKPIDPATGKYKQNIIFQNPADYTNSGPDSTEGHIQKFLFAVSAEYNSLAKRLASITGQPAADNLLCPLPLFSFSSSGPYNNMSFTISNWAKVKNENWLFREKAPETLPVFRAAPCPERVAVP